MKQRHEIDAVGGLGGGETTGPGLSISWQKNPLRGTEPTADCASVEDVLEAVIGRLEFYQTGNEKKFACREHAVALTHLETALLWIQKRSADGDRHHTRPFYGGSNG